MAGYTAMTRVQGGRVRAIAWADGRDAAPVDHAARPRDADTPIVVQARDVPTLRERWTWFREELAMMTFFLLDPESWR